MQQRPKIVHQITLGIAALLLLGFALWLAYGAELIEQIYAGTFHPAIDELVRQHRNLDSETRNLDFYQNLAETFLGRIFFLFFGSCMLLWLGWTTLQNSWHAFVAETVGPEQLAVFRLVTFGVLLYYPNYTAIFRMSALPEGLLVAPPGWAGLLDLLPPTPALAKISGSLYILGSLGAFVGYRTRWMALLATLAGIYFLGIPQFYGKIDHYHHLLWFAALAAFSPVSDRWSFDAWRNQKQIVRPALAYARFFQIFVILFAIIYFFAAWWKIIGGGMNWIWGDGAWLHLEAQAYRLGTLPPSWLAENDFLKSLLGLATLVLELCWGFAVLSKRFRPWILAAALFFHVSIYWLMQINFWQLPIFYLVFVPWGEIFGQKSFKIQHLMPDKPKALRWVGGILIVGNGLCGLAHFDSWPFAVYPSFGNPPEKRAKTFYLVENDGLGKVKINLESDLRLRKWLPKTRLQGLHNQLLRANDSTLHSKLKLLVPLYLVAINQKEMNYAVFTTTVDLENKQIIAEKIVSQKFTVKDD